MPFSEIQNDVTLSTSEKSITNNNTTIATNTTTVCAQLFLDLANMATGNELKVRLYEKVKAGGTQRIMAEWTLVGAQSPPAFVSPTFILKHGWDFALTGVSGTPVIPASIRPVPIT